MKKKLKLILLVLLVMAFAMSIVIGCAGSEGTTSSTQGSNQTIQNNEGNDEPIEISWTITMDLANNDSWSTTRMSEILKEKGYNVKFTVNELGSHDGTEWSEKFNLSVSSGDTPTDIIATGGLSLEALAAGWYAELNMDMLEKNMPKYVAEVERVYPQMWAYSKDPSTGKLYGITSFNMFGPTRHTFVYRQDWLSQLSIDPPETIDEFEEFLRLCRVTDFNGNGDFDEYGYTSGTDSPGAGFSEVFGSFGVMTTTWLEEDGIILRGEVMPGAKQALEVLAHWYKEDLIPKGINTTEKRSDGFYSGTRGTQGQADGYAPALTPTGANYAKLQSQSPGAELVAVPSFKGPTGLWGTHEWGPRKYSTGFGKHLEGDPEKLEFIIQMLETIATDEELFVAGMLGEKGTHWDFADPNADSGATIFLEPYTDYNKRLDEVGVREMSESAFAPIWTKAIYEKYLDPLAIEYSNQNPGYFDALLGISTAEQKLYSADLDNLTKEAFLEIITGKKPIDYFDDYVDKWYANGGEEMTSAAQNLYDSAFKK